MQNISFTNSIYWQYRYLHFPQMWENDIETVAHHNFKTISFKFHRFSCDILFYSEQISHTVFLMIFYFTVNRFLPQFFLWYSILQWADFSHSFPPHEIWQNRLCTDGYIRTFSFFFILLWRFPCFISK